MCSYLEMNYDSKNTEEFIVADQKFIAKVEYLYKHSGFTLFLTNLFKECENQPKTIKLGLRIIGLMSTSTDPIFIKSLIDNRIDKILRKFLESSMRNFRIDAAWILSNFFAGPPDQVGKLLQKNKLITALLNK